jgi:hypothetical protein
MVKIMSQAPSPREKEIAKAGSAQRPQVILHRMAIDNRSTSRRVQSIKRKKKKSRGLFLRPTILITQDGTNFLNKCRAICFFRRHSQRDTRSQSLVDHAALQKDAGPE